MSNDLSQLGTRMHGVQPHRVVIALAVLVREGYLLAPEAHTLEKVAAASNVGG